MKNYNVEIEITIKAEDEKEAINKIKNLLGNIFKQEKIEDYDIFNIEEEVF